MSDVAQRIDRATLIACLLGVIAWFVLSKPAPAPPPPPRLTALAAIPERSALAVTIDLDRVRKSPLAGLLSQPGLPGVGSLADACQQNPLTSASSLALGLPEQRGDLELGVVALGEFDKARILACAERMIETRGGKPTHTQVGSFTAIRDRRGSGGEVAIRDGGPLLLSEGRYLRDMIDSAEGRAPGLSQNALHQSLRARVGEDAAIVGSWLLPSDWVESVAGPITEGRTPLSTLAAAALRVDLSPLVKVQALFVCKSEKECAEVADYLADLRRELGPLLERRLGDNVLSQADVDVKQQLLTVNVSLEPLRALRLATRLFSD